MSLSDTQRIEILILLGCGDKTRTHKQVCEIFNTKCPDRRISQSTVSRIENKFREFGNVTDIPKSGRKRILDDEQKLDILLDIHDNPHKTTRQVAADNDVKTYLKPFQNNSEETQKTQNITKSRACAVGLVSMQPHLYTSVLVVAYQALTEKARQLKIVFPGQGSNNAHRGIATGKTLGDALNQELN
ncbi:hypothetical protein NQ318_017141 [Aromia moschata]|uniref:DUF4817 domain-containing protein n=1 Tax=Aromia moschata TaxID=1265417 RepID=A0AAV8XLC1_9CUCU|nr:hypothetical protein NQ318_017141 [Aromia moschata]